jgi:hypothetical protein
MHHLKAAKQNIKALEKWTEEYLFAWRRMYGAQIRVIDTVKLIPARWRPARLIGRDGM